MSNRDLLKEAIADAKAVKETAIANAKAALEEAFTPQLKSMLAAQILAEEESDEDLAEADKVNMEKEMEEGYGMDDTNEAEESIDEDFDLEEILAELDLEEGDDETMTEADEAEDLEEIDLNEMDDEELKAMIEDVINDMVAAGELETEESEEKVVMADEEDEEEVDMDDMGGEEEIEEGIKDVAKGLFKGKGTKVKEFVNDVISKNKELADKAKDDNTSYDQLYRKMAADLREKGVTGFTDTKPYRDELSMAITGKKAPETISKSASGLYTPGIGKKLSENEALAEALKTINILKQELNETNLLNSKLLYVNKIFRNKNLTESQKVKVLASFDKASNVKEVKLVYETLNEGLISKATTKSTIKESLGMASKPAGVAPKRPLNRNVIQEDAMVSRFQKLAGII